MPFAASFLLALFFAAQTPQAPFPPDYFKRMEQLSAAVAGKTGATEGEIQELLAAAMRDPNVHIRANAVGTVASIVAIAAMPHRPEGYEWAVRLRGVVEALQPEIRRALDDPEARVRMQAMRAFIGAVPSNPEAPLPIEMVQILATQYEKYPDSQLRGAIVMSLQMLYARQDAEAKAISARLLLTALKSDDPIVIQSAAMSVANSGVIEALPLLVPHLRHSSQRVRMAVSQGIGSYRATARPYLPQLQAALEAETDDITRKTIAGTISVITRK